MRSDSNLPSSSRSSNKPLSPNPAKIGPSQTGSATILEHWGITARQLTIVVNDNPSLRGMMLGCVAEHKFRKLVEKNPHVSRSKKDDDHDRFHRSDRIIVYKGMRFSIDVKSLQANLIRHVGGRWKGRTQVDASDRREVKLRNGKKLTTTLRLYGQFDILAVNCFAFENKWNFAFALNRDLPRARFRNYTEAQRDQLIASSIPVTWPPEPPFVDDPFQLVEKLYRERVKASRGTTSSSS